MQDRCLRGLEGQRLRLIITDGSAGLRAAVSLVWPQVPLERGGAHRLRDLADKVPKKEGSCVREAATSYQAPSRSQAQPAFQRWQAKWERLRPKAVASVERDLEERLGFFLVPQGHPQGVRTSNVIARALREVRPRTRPISSFTNPASPQRIIFGVITHLNGFCERKPLKQFTQQND